MKLVAGLIMTTDSGVGNRYHQADDRQELQPEVVYNLGIAIGPYRQPEVANPAPQCSRS